MTARFALIALPLALVGCGSKPATSGNLAGASEVTQSDAPLPSNQQATTAPPASGFQGTNQAAVATTASDNPVAAGAPLPPPTTTPAGAAQVVQSYYADLDRGDFRDAYALWGSDGADSRQSFDDFRRGFAATARTSVKTSKPTNGEGAAGSIYIDVPVTIHATLKDGTRQRYTGTYTLRRVDDVPGSTAAERRWHLVSATLTKG